MLAAFFLFGLIRALPLPPFGTIAGIDKIDNFRNPISVSRDVIAADVTLPGSPGATISVWRHDVPIGLPKKPTGIQGSDADAFLALGAVSPLGTVYAELDQPFSGAFNGIAFDTFVLSGLKWSKIRAETCLADSSFTAHTFQVDDGNVLDVTYEHSSALSTDEVRTGEDAPYAVRIAGARCERLGRFNLRAVSGAYAVGYRGYLFGGQVPPGVNTPEQRFVAVLVKDGRLRELGAGEAFSVAPDGFAVGSDAPPLNETIGIGKNIYKCCAPHPVAWTSTGGELQLAQAGVRGVAYAVDATHRVVGSVIGRDGRHYAFLWKRGHLQLLDDVVRAPGWRLEAAYGFTSDGSIVGAGTHNGTATMFVVN